MSYGLDWIDTICRWSVMYGEGFPYLSLQLWPFKSLKITHKSQFPLWDGLGKADGGRHGNGVPYCASKALST